MGGQCIREHLIALLSDLACFIEMLVVPSLHRGMLVSGLFHGIVKSSENGLVVLYGKETLIRSESTQSVWRFR